VTKVMNRSVRTTVVALLMASTAMLGALSATPASAGRRAVPEAAPTLQADYRFGNTLASSVPGAPRLRDINANGNNLFVPDGPRTVLRFPEGNGLRLGNATSVIPRGRYTIAIRMRFDTVTGYRRVVNFKPDSSDNSDTGLYVSDGDLVFYSRVFPDVDSIGAGELVTVVLTRSTRNRLRGYVDGVEQFDINDPNGRARIGANNLLRFFRDDANREESAGSVARIRLWDGPLTPAQVAAL